MGSPLAFSSFLYLLGGRPGDAGGPLARWAGPCSASWPAATPSRRRPAPRPGWLEDASPYALPALSGRFLGSWGMLLAVVAASALWRHRGHEAAFPLLALALWPLAALIAALRTYDARAVVPAPDLPAVLAGLAVLGTAAGAGRPRGAVSPG